jgi:hypothetical protein
MALTIKKTAVNEEDDTNVCAVEIQGRKVKLTVTKGNKVAVFEFGPHEWIEFILGTFDVEDMLRKLGFARFFGTREID